jgi:hypothetical protein
MPDKKAVGDWLRWIIDIFNRDWDPIGVMSLDEEWPDDEYQGYAGDLAAKLRAQAPDEELMRYLEWAEITNMGLSPHSIVPAPRKSLERFARLRSLPSNRPVKTISPYIHHGRPRAGQPVGERPRVDESFACADAGTLVAGSSPAMVNL